MASALGAKDLFRLVRKGIDTHSVEAHTRKPFRFLLAGDPALVADLRALLLAGHDGAPPLDAAACVETFVPGVTGAGAPGETRAAIFLGRRGDAAGGLGPLRTFNVPILALTVDPAAVPSGPPSAPAPGSFAEYVVPAIDRDALRERFFPHLVECSKGVEIAVGRRLPPLREAVAGKLTRDSARSALKVALASALVDHIPIVGVVLGAVASAGDMVAITGIQIALMMHIEAAYGRDPDFQRIWRMLPIVGGGLGWRSLARQLSGFIPVAGIAIKGSIAYAGTIVVGEGVGFFLEHGRHMSRGQAAQLFESTKRDALRFARDFAAKFRKS